jgi:hypothetical protein
MASRKSVVVSFLETRLRVAFSSSAPEAPDRCCCLGRAPAKGFSSGFMEIARMHYAQAEAPLLWHLHNGDPLVTASVAQPMVMNDSFAAILGRHGRNACMLIAIRTVSLAGVVVLQC